ncbi:MAG TPA: signal peptide peptidase SppA [Lacipirellulaceae bacterium]|nr:signal peptide peptidase SppA [Lacipirellulaceae bacterium]HMP06659.1 signal peptide peptidase SppA [Lacipirellulaceae bacterium]
MSADASSPQDAPRAAHVAAPPPAQVWVQQPPSAFGKYGRYLIVALVLAGVTIAGQYASYRSYFSSPNQPKEKYHSLNEKADSKVAILTIDGMISDPEGFVKDQIDHIRDDRDVVAIVLRINSPGGTIAASDYLYHRLRELARERDVPMVVSMGALCASGGYYLAMAAGDRPDVVFAEPMTWTGSIGVFIPRYDVSGLLTQWNVRDDTVASHKDKLMGSPTRQLTPEERAEERKLLQGLVDQSFDRFKEVVLAGRPGLREDPDKFAEATTGQIFTADRAKDLGLVDRLGFIEDAVARAAELADRNVDSLRCVKYEQPPTSLKMLLGAESPLIPAGRTDLTALLELTAPRAYYLCTWLPSAIAIGR